MLIKWFEKAKDFLSGFFLNGRTNCFILKSPYLNGRNWEIFNEIPLHSIGRSNSCFKLMKLMKIISSCGLHEFNSLVVGNDVFWVSLYSYNGLLMRKTFIEKNKTVSVKIFTGSSWCCEHDNCVKFDLELGEVKYNLIISFDIIGNIDELLNNNALKSENYMLRESLINFINTGFVSFNLNYHTINKDYFYLNIMNDGQMQVTDYNKNCIKFYSIFDLFESKNNDFKKRFIYNNYKVYY